VAVDKQHFKELTIFINGPVALHCYLLRNKTNIRTRRRVFGSKVRNP
jgi:hypothetical protein